MSGLEVFFGAKRRRRRVKRGRKSRRGYKKIAKSKLYITVGGKKRKLYQGKTGALYYRTKSGKNYVPKSVPRRRGHALSPKRRRRRSSKKTVRRRRSRRLKMTKKAIAARRAYRRRMARRSRFGLF